MSKIKSFLIGTTLGASTMFFTLQYHVVHSQDGLRVLPRAPQQSLGLAYADIRGWSASQWTDRPELARALMAHGSSDLISESVSNTLKDTVTEDSSTLDELRSFLNQIPASGAEPATSSATESPDTSTDKPASDPFRIPFPEDARTAGPADPFRVATTKAESAKSNAERPSRFSADEVRKSLNSDSSTSAEARAMEQRLFGTDPKSTSKPAVQPPKSSDEAAAPFEDVTSQLESRAQDALNRARSTVVSKSASTVESAKSAADGFVRSKVSEAVSTATGATAPNVPQAGDGASLIEFNPFLE